MKSTPVPSSQKPAYLAVVQMATESHISDELRVIHQICQETERTKALLNRSGKNGYPYLRPGLKGKAFIFSLLSRMVAVGLLYVTLIMLKYIHTISLKA